MRRFLISSSLLLLALAVPQAALPQDAAPADTSDTSADSSADATGVTADSSDLFLNAYMANETGEKLESAGDPERALEKYRYAASLLDQISHNDPNWQPVVVDYRKKRVSENIARLQAQTGGAQPPTTTPDANSVPLDGGMPTKEPLPGTDQAETAPEAMPIPGASDEAKAEITELQNDLRDSRQKLKSVETEKAALAGRLDDALKQLDQTKVNVVELKGELQKVQDAYQNSIADHGPVSGAQKQYQARINQLEDALKDAEADRDAADEENSDYARRATKSHQATAAIAQQRDAAIAKNKDLQAKFADASRLADQLDAANKQIATLSKARDAATQHASDLEDQLANTSKAAARLVAAEK